MKEDEESVEHFKLHEDLHRMMKSVLQMHQDLIARVDLVEESIVTQEKYFDAMTDFASEMEERLSKLEGMIK